VNVVVGLTVQDLAELDTCAAQLRSEGWAAFVTYAHLLASWRSLGKQVAAYQHTVDDYTNDLTSREGLNQLMRRCHPMTALRLSAELEELDTAFRAGTDHDATGALGLFFRIDESSGWWLRRIPKIGPLRDYLDTAFRG
jgi:hypothetical protein